MSDRYARRVSQAQHGDDSSTATDVVRRLGRHLVRAGAMATADLRIAPDLVIIGTKRGGTTSLFRDLERHPAMLPLVPSARRLPLRENQKGVHFFDTGHDAGHRWYRSHFATRITAAHRRRRAGAAFTAEASPYLLFHPLAPQRVAAAPASSIRPDTFFVVLLRDPVERTVSHWAEQTRNGVETLSLADALDAEDERVGDDHERLASGELRASFAHEQQSYAAQSEYAASLQRWIDAVGAERLLVDLAERYYADPAVVLGAITDRLGVEPIDDAGVHRNAAPRPSELDPAIERRLVNRFRTDVNAVGDLLGRRPDWPRFASTSSGAL